jgi:hypothetical protein
MVVVAPTRSIVKSRTKQRREACSAFHLIAYLSAPRSEATWIVVESMPAPTIDAENPEEASRTSSDAQR